MGQTHPATIVLISFLNRLEIAASKLAPHTIWHIRQCLALFFTIVIVIVLAVIGSVCLDQRLQIECRSYEFFSMDVSDDVSLATSKFGGTVVRTFCHLLVYIWLCPDGVNLGSPGKFR